MEQKSIKSYFKVKSTESGNSDKHEIKSEVLYTTKIVLKIMWATVIGFHLQWHMTKILLAIIYQFIMGQ